MWTSSFFRHVLKERCWWSLPYHTLGWEIQSGFCGLVKWHWQHRSPEVLNPHDRAESPDQSSLWRSQVYKPSAFCWFLRDEIYTIALSVHVLSICNRSANLLATFNVLWQKESTPKVVKVLQMWGKIRRESRTGEVKLDVLSHYYTSQTLLGWETGMGDRRAAERAKGTWRSRTHSCSQAAQSHLWALSTNKLSSV